MKNKKFTYSLFACVIALWGWIFFKVYTAINEEEIPIVQDKPQKTILFNLINHENDSIKLDLNYRNPFLESGIDPVVEQVRTVAPASASTMSIKKNLVNWPDISFKGSITNAITRQKIALVFIDGKEIMLTEGQTLNGLKLLKYGADSIKVKYQTETRFIRLK